MSVQERRSDYESIPDGPDSLPNLRDSFYVPFDEEITLRRDEKVSRVGIGILGAIAILGSTGLESLLISPQMPNTPFFAIVLGSAAINCILCSAIGYGILKISGKKPQTSALSLHKDVYTVRGLFDVDSSHLSRGVDGQLLRDGYNIRFSDANYFLKDPKAFHQELVSRGLLSYENLLKTLSTQGPIDQELMRIADLVRDSKQQDHFTDFFSTIIRPNQQQGDGAEPVYIIHDSFKKISTIQTKVKRTLEDIDGENLSAGIYDVTLVVEWISLSKLLTIARTSSETP